MANRINVDPSSIPQLDSTPQSKQNILFEQIGTTGAISKSNVFEIELASGASEDPINPLPDLDD